MKVFLHRILQEIMKKIILGTSDAWSMIHLSHRPSNPPYYIVNWQIFDGQSVPGSKMCGGVKCAEELWLLDANCANVFNIDWTPQDCWLWFEQWVQLRIEASRDLQSQMWIWHAILTNYNKKRIQKSTSWNFFKCSYRYLFLSMQELINMECSFDFSKTDTSLKLWQDWKGWIFVCHPRPFLLEGIKGLKKHGTGGYQEDFFKNWYVLH